MAKFSTTITTPWSAERAFAFMSDVRNFSSWDPGVSSSEQVRGDGPGLDSAYDLAVKSGPRTTTMRYEVVEWDAPKRLLLVAKTSLLESVDEIRVESAAGGARVTYDAELTMSGLLRMADPLLGLAFQRIGARADAGLRRALEAEPAT